jgi:hypothetical protein
MKKSCRTLLASRACVAITAMASALAWLGVGCAELTCSDTATCPPNDSSVREGSVDTDESDQNDDVEIKGDADATTDADATVDSDGDASTSPDGDATVGQDGDASTSPDGDATVGQDGDGSTSPDGDATFVPDGDSSAMDREVGVQDSGSDSMDTGPAAACDATPGYECVASLTATSWIGPVAVSALVGSGTTPAPCPSNFASLYDTLYQGSGPAAGPVASGTCQCSCTASGQSCSSTVHVFSDMSCSGLCSQTAITTGCSNLTTIDGGFPCGNSGSIEQPSPPTATGGTCSPQGTIPDAGSFWTGARRMCTPSPYSNNVCPSNELCAPVPTAAYRLGVYRTDMMDASCPLEYPSGPWVYYQGSTDGRSCPSCKCTTSIPAGGTCGGGISLYGGSGCVPSSVSTVTDSGTPCNGYGGGSAAGSIQANFTLLQAGSCTPVEKTAAPDGSVTGTGVVTFCLTN